MYQVKSRIFNDLTKNQKSDFLSFLKIYTKNFKDCDEQSIFYNLIDELAYFKELGQGRFDFVNVDNDEHLKWIKEYISACKKYFSYKDKMKPVYEEQKRIQKEIKAKILEAKQKKEPPTKKQISYYKSLCKRKGEDTKDVELLSKYDIKLEIQRLVDGEQ